MDLDALQARAQELAAAISAKQGDITALEGQLAATEHYFDRGQIRADIHNEHGSLRWLQGRKAEVDHWIRIIERQTEKGGAQC